MNVLIVGSGGREHALADHFIEYSEGMNNLLVSPGNVGINGVAYNSKVEDLDIINLCYNNDIELVVIGSEEYLASGLASKLRTVGFNVIGPELSAARLETSKSFMRLICHKRNIHSPDFWIYNNCNRCKTHVTDLLKDREKIVVKYDGLARGKGVVVAETKHEAHDFIDAIFNGKFGNNEPVVLLEDYIEGTEASLFYLCNGTDVINFGSARDYKKLYDGDSGPNTGGMGAYSPFMGGELDNYVKKHMVVPVLEQMAEMGFPFQGFLYAGVILTGSEVYLLEFNTRLGDPEAQALLPRLKTDMLPLLYACAHNEKISDFELKWDKRKCANVVMANRGYPNQHASGDVIGGIHTVSSSTQIYHSGTDYDYSRGIIAMGGRVLSVSVLADNFPDARKNVYEEVNKINWKNKFFRKDICLVV